MKLDNVILFNHVLQILPFSLVTFKEGKTFFQNLSDC